MAICSGSITFSNLRITKKYEHKLTKAQRKLAKKVNGSNNFNKQRLKVANIHEKIAHVYADFTHKITTKLIHESQVICLESLNIKNRVKNKKLAKHILDANLGKIVRQLEYKATWYGQTISKIDQ